jgi:hypothetical protein
VLSVLVSCSAIPIQNDGADQHDTENDHLVVRTEAKQIHAVGENGDEHDAQNDADDGALPATQGAAADHRGGNGSKRKFCAQQGLARRHAGRQQKTRDRRQNRAAKVCDEQNLRHRNAGDQRRPGIGAGGVEVAAEAGPTRQDIEKKHDWNRDQRRNRYLPDKACAEHFDKRLRQPFDLQPLTNQKRQALEYGSGRQRDDERIDLEKGDAGRIANSGEGAHPERRP